VNACLTGNPKVVLIPYFTNQKYSVRRSTLIDCYPPGIVGNPRIQSEFHDFSFARLQRSITDLEVCAFFEFNLFFKASESRRKKINVAADNMRGGTSDIYDLKPYNTSNRFTKHPVAYIVAKRFDYCMANYNFRSVLQHKIFIIQFPRLLHFYQLILHQFCLFVDRNKGENSSDNTTKANKKQTYVWGIFGTLEATEIVLRLILGPLALYGGAFLLYFAGSSNPLRIRWGLGTLAIILIAAGLGAFFFPIYWQDNCKEYRDCQTFPHDAKLYPKNILTSCS
jgi:hypothetical protein